MTLSRARTTLRQHTPSPEAPPAPGRNARGGKDSPPPGHGSAAHDIDAVVSLLTDDIQMTMPPRPRHLAGVRARRRVPDPGGVPAGPKGTLRRDTRER